MHGLPILGVGFMLKKQIWDLVGGYDKSVLVNGREDAEWWIRAFHQNRKIVVIDEPLYVRRAPEPGQENEFLNYSSMRRERESRWYIVQAHAYLYRGEMFFKLRMLAKRYWWEGGWRAEHGETLKGWTVMVTSLIMVPSVYAVLHCSGFLRRRLTRK